MENNLTASDVDRLIKKEEKRYGKALGHLIGKGVGETKVILELLEITTRHESLVSLRKNYLTPVEPAPEPVAIPETQDTEPQDSDEPGTRLPDGICDSESCEDEFCVAYWEEIEGHENED